MRRAASALEANDWQMNNYTYIREFNRVAEQARGHPPVAVARTFMKLAMRKDALSCRFRFYIYRRGAKESSECTYTWY